MKKLVVVMIALLLFIPSVASAHAELVDSQPKQGETVTQSIDTLTLQFGEGVEKFIHFTLTNGNGESIPIDSPNISGKTVLVLAKKPLANGDYTAKWELVSADGHNATGELTFKVGMAEKSKTETKTPVTHKANLNHTTTQKTSHQALYIGIIVVLIILIVGSAFTVFRKK